MAPALGDIRKNVGALLAFHNNLWGSTDREDMLQWMRVPHNKELSFILQDLGMSNRMFLRGKSLFLWTHNLTSFFLLNTKCFFISFQSTVLFPSTQLPSKSRENCNLFYSEFHRVSLHVGKFTPLTLKALMVLESLVQHTCIHTHL